MSEITIAYLTDEYNFTRRKATMLNIGVAMVLGTLCALSFSSLSTWTICGKTIFNLFDYVSSNILLPLSGMMISIFVGWVLKRSVVTKELTTKGVGTGLISVVVFLLKYVAPACIMSVFLFGLMP